MEEEESKYPSLDPTNFDVVLCGTGFPQSLLAAAAAAAGKTVLHIDPNPFYGSHFSSVPLSSFSSFLRRSESSSELQCRRLYSEVEETWCGREGSAALSSGRIMLDLVGPRAIYCGDEEMVELLWRTGASHHVEFKSIDASLIYWDGILCPVPCDKNAIFRDRSLSLLDKRRFTKFLQRILSHLDGTVAIADEDLGLPFVQFLRNHDLPAKIQSIILYAIAMADHDQDYDSEQQQHHLLLTTKEGIDKISLYVSSIGRFPNALGAFLYPMYGHGELPQAFCRCAAVKGALYVLRMPVSALLFDEESKQIKGVRLASGQDISSHHLVMDPAYHISAPSPSFESLASSYIARGVCIISKSFKTDASNILLILPPRALHEKQRTTIRVLQLSSNVAVCPSGLFVVHLSTPCADASLGKDCINEAINALLTSETDIPENNVSENVTNDQTESTEMKEEAKPMVLWKCTYVQQNIRGSGDAVCLCPPPDECLDYRKILESTKKLFEKMYPEEQFLPKNSAAEDPGNEIE